MKKRIKTFFYNEPWDFMIIVVFFIISIAVYLVSLKAGLICLILLSVYIAIYRILNAIINKEMKYLKCTHSILFWKRMFINQINSKKNINECPRKEFCKELIKLSRKLPEGRIYRCVTHEIVLRQICKYFKNVKYDVAYKKDLKKLKGKLKKGKCKGCTVSGCPIVKSELTQFYCVEIRT